MIATDAVKHLLVARGGVHDRSRKRQFANSTRWRTPTQVREQSAGDRQQYRKPVGTRGGYQVAAKSAIYGAPQASNISQFGVNLMGHNLRMIPSYWEPPMLEDGYVRMWERDWHV